MSIEDEIFKKSRLIKEKLLPYGFKKEGNNYKYSKLFMNNTFRADICIDDKDTISGKIFDLDFDEEYTNFRVENAIGEFVNTVKEEYIDILSDIEKNCYQKECFIYPQSNRIANIVYKLRNVKPEFLWDSSPDAGVFRNPRSDKWFGIIMHIKKSKILSNEPGDVEVLNVKLDNLVQKKLEKNGIFPAYHMNKKSWVSIVLDDTLSDKEIMELLDSSYELSNIKGEWIVPANPKYFDVIDAFNKTDIIYWKQSNNILVGDIVYLYVAEPYSALMFKCEALEVNIPRESKNKNVNMKKAMRIKLLKKYRPSEFSFKKLNELGVKAIRGPRSLTKELRAELNKKEQKGTL